MKILTFLLIVLFIPSVNWLGDFNTATTLANKEDRLILINFSGSDWCGPCIRLRKEILESATFEDYAKDHLVLVRADFPRQKKNQLDAGQIKRNEALADKYNPDGKFPFTLLVDKNGKVLKKWDGFPNETKNNLAVHQRALRLMGNRFEISVVGDNAALAQAHIDSAIAEINRIEKLLTTFSDDSQTNLINHNAGISPVQVDREVFDLIARSIKISDITQGAFDITYGSNMTQLPDAETARKAVKLINYKNVVLDEENITVFLKEKGMRIGFGGIGKGYAAERAKLFLKQHGVESGIVNASGDLTAWGVQPDGNKWTIGIANPDLKHEIFSYLNISDLAIATSGNYEKFAVIGGKKYSHTINPHTGLPVGGIKSVTIITTNAEVADAMATPVMIMGIKVGLDLINQMKNIAAVIIDDNNNLYTSNNINLK
jgi:thiamine biosynthesis lipoprotein